MAWRMTRTEAAMIAGTPVVYLAVVAWTWPRAQATFAMMALALAYPTAVFTVVLLRRAWIVRLSENFRPCRGTGLLGMGVLTGGLGLVGAAVAPADLAASVLAIGLIVAAVMYALGLLMLPGVAPSWTTRVGRLLDGLVIGSCLFFAAWTLIVAPLRGQGPGPRGMEPTLVVLVCYVLAAGLSTAVLAALRAVHHRRAAVRCAGGVGLALSGSTAVVVLSLLEAPDPALWGATTVWATGLAVLWTGVRRTRAAPSAPWTLRPPEGPDDASLLIGPIGWALVGAFHHVVTVGRFGFYTAMAGVAMLLAITAREWYASLNAHRSTARCTRRGMDFRCIAPGLGDVTVAVDTDQAVGWQSAAVARRLGVFERDVSGRSFLALIHPDDRERVIRCLGEASDGVLAGPWTVEFRLWDKAGRWRTTKATVTEYQAASETASLTMRVRDASVRGGPQQAPHHLAFTDSLTGLPNRRALCQAIEEKQRRAAAEPWVVLAIGLDGFKRINDVRGHDIGDAILVEVANRLRAALGDRDLVARIAGGEFAVLTVAEPDQARAMGTRLFALLTEPYRLAYGMEYLTVSIGIARGDGTSTVEEILRAADLALRHAKRSGRGRVEWFDESLEYQMLRRLTFEHELRGAIERGELDLAYQPIVALTDSRPVGAEALLRWRHPTLGPVNPAEFMPVAEDIGLITQIEEWVLHHGLRRLAQWRAEGRDVWLSVNISPHRLRSAGFVGDVAALLDIHRVPADRLVVEISERGMTGDAGELAAPLAALRALGTRTALDDFGAGYSSLAQLRRLPVDLLKIDQTLITDPVVPGGSGGSLSDVVVCLGQRLGMEVVAEGVEHPAQRELLTAAGCHFGQGHLFSRPLPAEHVEAYFDAPRRGNDVR